MNKTILQILIFLIGFNLFSQIQENKGYYKNGNYSTKMANLKKLKMEHSKKLELINLSSLPTINIRNCSFVV